MQWSLQLNVGNTKYTVKAERIFMNNQIEQIKITGEAISVVLENNRPLLEYVGIHRPLTWKVTKGKLNDPAVLEQITKELEQTFQTAGK
jgi:hypothetical protein